MKISIIYLHTIPLSIQKIRETLRMEGHTAITHVNKITLTRVPWNRTPFPNTELSRKVWVPYIRAQHLQSGCNTSGVGALQTLQTCSL